MWLNAAVNDEFSRKFSYELLSNFRFYLYDKFIKTYYNSLKLYDVFISLSNNDLFLNNGLMFIIWNNYYDDDLYIYSMGYRYDMLRTIGEIKKMAKINFLSFQK